MKTFYEMLGLLDNSPGDKLGLGERGAVDFMQLSNGHWAGHVYSGEVFVTKERYPIGQRPDSAFSTFKYQPSRRATQEEKEEYNRRHDEFEKTQVDFDPNYESTLSKNKVVREAGLTETYAYQNDMNGSMSNYKWREKLGELRRISTEGLKAAQWATAYVWHGPGREKLGLGVEQADRYHDALERATSKLEEFAAAMKEFDDIED
jgi:hypothetical protein